LDDLIA
jgi:hypothetical protein